MTKERNGGAEVGDETTGLSVVGVPDVAEECELVPADGRQLFASLAERLAEKANERARAGLTAGCREDVWIGMALAIVAEAVAAVVDEGGK